jgi:anthranilate phosphoribosyltransferase
LIREAIGKVIERQDLTTEEAKGVMLDMIGGNATHSQMASFITAMRMKGETELELIGFAKAMRENACRITAPEGTVDLCGTGGDGSGTINISTIASFVVASAGVPVAKHGNRSMSSSCGSADLLSALGIPYDLEPEQVERCIGQTNLGFLFAPKFHKSMANIGTPRREIGIRTFFNILGPLSNPAEVKYQLMGTYDANLSHKLARVLKGLGTEKALIVNSQGMDEITNIGLTNVVELSSGEIEEYEISPDMLGLKHATRNDLKGGDPHKNARIALSILKGERSARADAVAMNAAAAIYAADAADSIAEGLETARRVMRNGEALGKLKEFAELSERLESERQSSMPIDSFLARRMTRDTLLSRSAEFSDFLIKEIMKREGGAGRLSFLAENGLSERNILTAISLRRLLTIIDGTKENPISTARRSRERLSDAIRSNEGIAIIGEYKPAYPSMPSLSPPPDVREAIEVYSGSDLAGVSVLAEPNFFSGGDKLFSSFREEIEKPMLFKDFVVSEEQIETASRLGADAVLLIVKMLSRQSLEQSIGSCQDKGMEPMVELHDEEDLEKLRTCVNFGSVKMIGLNSRDLRTMKTDIGSIINMRKLIPEDRLAIAESGIGSASDLKTLTGFDAALIGSLFMRGDDIRKSVEDIVTAGRSVSR